MIHDGFRLEERMKQRRQEREEKEKKVTLSIYMYGLCSITAALTQEAIEREKIRRKGGKDITDLKQK